LTSFDYHFFCWTQYSPWSIPCFTCSCAGWVYTDPVPAVGDILPECVPPRLGLLRTQPPWASQQPLRLQEAAQPNTQLFQVQDLNFGFVSPFWFHLCSCIFLVLWDQRLYVVYIWIHCQWRGIVIYHWWTASIQLRLLFSPCKLCFFRTFSQIHST